MSGTHMACVDQAAKTLKVVHEYIMTGMETTLDVAIDLVDQGQDGPDEKVKNLKEIMLDYSEMDRDIQQFMAATDHVLKESREEEGDLEQILKEKLEQLRQNNSPEELHNHEKYSELLDKLQPLEHPDKQNAPLTEDLAFTQQEVQTKCPYTGKEMTDPVKNKLCGHSYDRKGIMELIKNRRGKAKCPLGGCVNDKPIEVEDLEENRDLRRIIERKKRDIHKRK